MMQPITNGYNVFAKYLLDNEQYLATDKDVNGVHETDGKIDADEVSAFFEGRNIEMKDGKLVGFEEWFGKNHNADDGYDAIGQYMKELGIEDEAEMQQIMYDSMLEYYNALGEDGTANTYELLNDYAGDFSEFSDTIDPEATDEETLNQIDEAGLTSFNFMEGRDAADMEAYHEQVGKLAANDIASKDVDGNGELSYEEYLDSEMQSAYEVVADLVEKGEITQQEAEDMLVEQGKIVTALFENIETVTANANAQYAQMSGVTDKEQPDSCYDNINNSISQEEMQNYYEFLDSLTIVKNDDGGYTIDMGNSVDGNLEGKIMQEYTSAIGQTRTEYWDGTENEGSENTSNTETRLRNYVKNMFNV